VRLYSSDATNPTFLGLGIVLDDSGTIIADQSLLGDAADAVIELPGSTRIRGFVRSRNDATGVAYLTAASSTSQGAIAWKPAQFAPKRPPLGSRASDEQGFIAGASLLPHTADSSDVSKPGTAK
jgi:hypothetical protein